jgi:hypothetical protein
VKQERSGGVRLSEPARGFRKARGREIEHRQIRKAREVVEIRVQSADEAGGRVGFPEGSARLGVDALRKPR